MADTFFAEVPGRIPFGGSARPTRSRTRSTSPTGSSSASGWRTTSGSRVCLWHSFTWPGSDVFGVGTFDRPWLDAAPRPDDRGARRSSTRRSSSSTKLGVPFFCFHDRDVAPEGATLRRDAARTSTPSSTMRRGTHGADRRPAAVGHGEPVRPSALHGRRGHEPRPRGVRLRGGAGQAHARGDAAARRRELRPVGRPRGLRDAAQHGPRARGASSSPGSWRLVAEHKHQIGFKGTLLIEPKPQEPTKHQYDYDAATVHGFLVRHGLEGEYRLNLEANHATLAGHSFHHEVAYAVAHGIFGSIDANRGDYQNGWDTDQFPNSVDELVARRSTRSSAAAGSRPAASTSTPSCAARASTGPTCSTPTSAASTRSPGRCSSPPTWSSGGRSSGSRERALRRLGRRARPGDPRRRRVSLEELDGAGRAGRHRPAAGVRAARSCSRTSSTGASGRPTRSLTASSAEPTRARWRLRPRHRRLDDGDEGRPVDESGAVAGIGTAEYGFEVAAAALERAGPGAVVGRGGRRDPVGPGRRPASPATTVAAVGLTGQMHGLVLLDAADRGPAAGDPVERPADRRRVRRDPRGGRAGAADRDHRQRRADGLHRAEARLGPRPRAGRLARDRPRAPAQGLRPARA